MFSYEWFYGSPLTQQQQIARWRCMHKRFPEAPASPEALTGDARRFYDEIETRTVVYLRDGFSYEVADVIDAESKSQLMFECAAVEEAFKVGSFVVTAPFEEVARVEVFAVHASEKPEDAPQITGFRKGAVGHEPGPPPLAR